jgi:hypothetical protein
MATEYNVQTVQEAPAIEAARLGLMQSAKDLATRPIELPAYQAAGLSETQRQSIDLAKRGLGAYQPYINAAGQNIGAGAGLTQAAAQGIGGINVAPQYQQAYGMMGTGAQQAGQAAQAIGGGMYGYDPSRAAAFMNPYQEAVTQNALREMRRQGDIAGQGQAAQAIRAGAFGGTREGVQRAETERNLQDLMQQRILQDYSQNYGQAQQAAQQSFEAQQGRQLAGGQALGNVANIYGQLGQGIGSLAGQYGQFGLQQGTALGQMGGQLGQLGTQQAALGQLGSQLGQGEQGFLFNLGSAEQQNAQQQLDAYRATQTQKAMFPYQQLAFVSDIYKGTPSSQISTTAQSAPTPSPLMQAASLGIAGLSAASGAAKAGLF